jgi:hypothetical protein
MKRYFCIFTVLTLISLPSFAHAAVFNVTPNGGSNCNLGPCDLQSAFDAAEINGEDNVLNLAAGVFSASLGTFKYEPVVETGSLTLQGDPGGGTLIDGSGQAAMRISTLGSNFQNPVPDALSNVSISNITFQGGVGSDHAGGLSILTNDASVVVDQCKFFRNKNINTSGPSTPDFGGGGLSIYSIDFGSITLTNNEFRNNGVSSDGGGGFLLAVLGDMIVQGNNFVGNFASSSFAGGNGISASGFSGAGGLFALAVSGSLNVDRNYFFGNFADTTSAGMLAIAALATGTITNNIILNNTVVNTSPSTTSSAIGGGGAIIAGTGTLNIGNNTIADNRVTNGDGGGLVVFSVIASFQGGSSAKADIYNNIVFNNVSSGGVDCLTSCNDIFVIDSDFSNPSSTTSSTVNVFNNDYSDISFTCDPNLGCVPQETVDPITNFTADPLFVSEGTGDVHLLSGSRAIDKGTAFAPVIPTVDFDGKPRNQGKDIDLGALEFSSAPTENCANGADDDGDGLIDCKDPDCSGAAACRGGEGGGEGGGGITPNAGNGGGCSLMSGPANPSFISLMTIPLLLMMRRFRRRS